jgi:cytochrome oxidase Cu insertion factor (SCO1/SenC/PrrC family)
MHKNPLLSTVITALLFISVQTVSWGQDTLLYPSLPPGIKAPGFKGEDENGRCQSLANIKSRYILLYFYEVHCHLCEVVTPELKKLYDSYHKTGLEVIAIPVGSDKDEWKNYVAGNKLNWKNIFPGKNQDVLKSDYMITVSPTIYLLGKDKILLTQRMGRIEQVEAELNQRIR